MALYAFNRREDDDIDLAEKELFFSIGKTYDLYHYLLLLVVEVADIALEKIEQSGQKKMPTPEDLNPNRKFVANQVIEQLRTNKTFNSYISSRKLSWANYRHVPRLMYNRMLVWDKYEEYMKPEVQGYMVDRKFVINMVTRLFAESEDLESNFEEQSIYWNDDMEYVAVMIEKTLKKFKSEDGDNARMMPLFKNKEDEDFVKTLFRNTVLHIEQNSDLIDRNTTNWEIERIALMDILVMQLAITEIMEFPEIPIRVTLNEYIEIAKYYCTSKSSTFVNGILDNIVKEIRDKGLFTKTGKGLIGETTED